MQLWVGWNKFHPTKELFCVISYSEEYNVMLQSMGSEPGVCGSSVQELFKDIEALIDYRKCYELRKDPSGKFQNPNYCIFG
jgi:hypothetical protein